MTVCPTCNRTLPTPVDPSKPKSRGSWKKILGPLPPDEGQREAFEMLIDEIRAQLVRDGLDADSMHGGYYVILPALYDWLRTRQRVAA